MPRRDCPCGSGQYPTEMYDARGISIGYVCNACEKRKMAQFRPEIFTDPNYACDEDIEGDE